MNTAFRATMLAGVSLCALFAAAPAVAQQSANLAYPVNAHTHYM